MNKIILHVFFFIFVSACSNSGEGYMQQNELQRLIEKKQSPIIVDVRSSFEYKAGHVPGAIHVPFWSAFSTDKMNGYDKDNTVVLYCEHGPRAGIAKFALFLSGFKNINYLAGHMTAWKKANLPVESAKNSE